MCGYSIVVSHLLTMLLNTCVFCRGGKDQDGEMRYNPFRITPYLLKVQAMTETVQQPCCLALAERIISGYEGTARLQPSVMSETFSYCFFGFH